MSLCNQLRPYLDGETTPLEHWRMRRHLRHCPACSTRKAAEEALGPFLDAGLAYDAPEEAEALARVERRWRETLAAPRAAAAEAVAPPEGSRAARLRWRFASPRWLTASAALVVATALFVGAVTAPSRALAGVAGAMARVQRFHVRMELPGLPIRYEAWGERNLGARVEEWEGGRRTSIILDDGKRLQRYMLDEALVRESDTRLQKLFRQAANFSATRILRRAARGKLFEGEEWLGRATAREVAKIRRHGIFQRRIQIDLEDGMFERMILYAELETDRLTQANLYTDSNRADEEPFARVFFEYPAQLAPNLLRLDLPPGTPVRRETNIDFP